MWNQLRQRQLSQYNNQYYFLDTHILTTPIYSAVAMNDAVFKLTDMSSFQKILRSLFPKPT